MLSRKILFSIQIKKANLLQLLEEDDFVELSTLRAETPHR